MADDKETVNHAVAGDIIGLYDTGTIKLVIHWLAVNKNIVFKIYPNLPRKYL